MLANPNLKQIKDEMLKAVNDSQWEKELIDLALSFIVIKVDEGLPFGQLTLHHYHMFGGGSQEIYKAAAAVELMILALDIFDDLQDQDANAHLWNQQPPAISMNVAIGLLSLCTMLLNRLDTCPEIKVRMMSCLHEQIGKAVQGQHLDLRNEIQNEEDYFRMAKQKSGSLLSCACLLGTMLAEKNQCDTVNEYAVYMGVAAQVDNDIRDILRWDEKSDFLARKKTLPVLYLLKNSQAPYALIRDYYSYKIDKIDILSNQKQIQSLIEQSGSLHYASVHKRIYQLKALDIIENLTVSLDWKEKLKQFI